MKLLWLSWKDVKHPQAGGAEVVNHELMKRLVAGGHRVTLLTSRPRRDTTYCAPTDTIDGVDIIRVGQNRYFHSFQALWYYRKYLKNKFDCIVECVNAAPYFVQYFKGTKKLFLFYHQLAREVSFYETWFPLNALGFFILEPMGTFLQSRNNIPVITVSESTQKDLMKFGFRERDIHVISEGIELAPIARLADGQKNELPTLLYLGSLRAMKRVDHVVKAFLFARRQIPNLVLWVGGGGEPKYVDKLKSLIRDSKFIIPDGAVKFTGHISLEQKIELLQKSHLVAVTSVKEGWGLVVTEAASQGTPAVVYDVDGLRDSVKKNETGIICKKNTPDCLAKNIAELLQDTEKYERLRRNAWELSKKINFEQSYEDFKKATGI